MTVRALLVLSITFLIILSMYLSAILLFSGCTNYSVTMIHSEGNAQDKIDENQTESPQINPTVSIPASLIP